jgi:phenylpyruvate tautomerase PptA (4-oxalocrotonate tautomerase family)
MPRWTIHSTVGALSASEKDSIAKQVTELYCGLGPPPFFINVFFHDHPVGNFYSGGELHHNSVFFHIDHAARGFDNQEVRVAFIKKVNSIVEPILGPTQKKWEYNIYEHPKDNWRINGMIPPIDHPEILAQWREKNDALPWVGSGIDAPAHANALSEWSDAIRVK